MKSLLPVQMCAMMALTLTFGCATTKVTRNPAPECSGIRYYRPKPYLLVQPDSTAPEDRVAVSLEYLPDFSEEYAIEVKAGFGINETSLKLEDGWNLTEITQKLDSQTDENIKAAADLLGAAASAIKPTEGREGNTKPEVRLICRANNVPLGFYEAVISLDQRGLKQLYGWRYVGFHPFNACPLQSAGGESTCCSDANIFAMVFREGVMTFLPINEVAVPADLNRIDTEVQTPSAAVLGILRNVTLVDSIKTTARNVVDTTAMPLHVTDIAVGASHLNLGQIEITVTAYPNSALDSDQQDNLRTDIFEACKPLLGNASTIPILVTLKLTKPPMPQ